MRLIDADDLGVGRCSKDVLPAAYCAGWNGLLGLIEKAPTVDAVPVVRCKDCKYSCKDRNGRTCEGYWYELSEFAVPVEDDGFCSYGERKDGGNADENRDPEN